MNEDKTTGRFRIRTFWILVAIVLGIGSVAACIKVVAEPPAYERVQTMDEKRLDIISTLRFCDYDLFIVYDNKTGQEFLMCSRKTSPVSVTAILRTK